MPYTHITFKEMRTALAQQLADEGNVFWTDNDADTYKELSLYIVEALRVWSALTGAWRERGAFNTTASTAFYDLSTKLPALLGYTLQDKDLIAEMQFHLMEKVNPAAWQGSEMFSLDGLTRALERRVHQFLSETGVVVTRSLIDAAPPPTGRVPLPETTIDVRRLAWVGKDTSVPPGDVYTNLWREDEWALNAFAAGWAGAPNTPAAYSVALTPPVSVQLAPPPSDVGRLELLGVHSSAILNPAVGVALGIPDDLAWAVKWGALGDLLDGDVAVDRQRSDYCEQRYQQGVTLARLMPSVLQAQVDGSPVPVVSVADLDTDSPGWQNSTGTPMVAALAGANLMALSFVPDDKHSVTLDVMRKAPVPTKDADKVQLGRDELDAILSYAEHIASFKQGGSDFADSQGGFEDMVRMAAVRNGKLRTQATFLDALGDLAIREEIKRPRREAEPQGG